MPMARQAPDVHHRVIINHHVRILHGISYAIHVRRIHHNRRPPARQKNKVPDCGGKFCFLILLFAFRSMLNEFFLFNDIADTHLNIFFAGVGVVAF